MKVTLQGAEALRRKLTIATAGTPNAMTNTLVQTAERVITAAKQSYVPVDLGPLRASGFVAPPVQAGTKVHVDMGFGGPSAPYALIQHEDLTFRHRVGQAKYLEIPFNAIVRGMPAVAVLRTRDAIRQAFQRLRKVEANVRAGRDVNWGTPLFGAAG